MMHGPGARRGRMPDVKVDMKASMKKITVYFRKDLVIMAIALVFAAGGAVLTIVGPNKIGAITDYMQAGLFSSIDLKGVAGIVFTMLAIYLGSAIFTFTQHFIMSTVTLKASRQMRSDISRKINRVPQAYFNKHSQGDILSRVTNDVSTLQQGLSNGLPGIISSIAQFVGCLLMMFITEWRLALCTIGVSMLGMAALMIVMGKSQKHFVTRQKHLGNLNGYVEEMYGGHEVVRISRAGNKIRQHFAELNDKVYDSTWHAQFLSGLMGPLMNVVGNLAYVTVCVIGALLAMNGTITFGVIVSFIMYTRLFTSPLTQIAQGLTNLQSACASADRIFEFLEEEELSDESDKPEKLPAVRGEVTFDHVRFAYPDTPDKVIIHDFSAHVKPGQKVAIVGPTGAGKTTMVNLLMRFFEVNSGSIAIDGTPITDLRREGIHDLFSMVLQDTWLFDGSVRDNLCFNLQGVSDEDLERVCAACGLSHFVHSLPQGFDTMLTESASISAGQKQLLTIARAMLQNSPMLILDEATSSVDTRTELIIQQAMDHLMTGRTSFVIAHRLSTIRDADLILVMKNGDVIESGNHEELMARGGFYAELYNSQFETAA